MKSEIAGTLVEWDENKNQLNIRKHGISFQTAALVFADEERINTLTGCTVRMKSVTLSSDAFTACCMLFTRCGKNMPG